MFKAINHKRIHELAVSIEHNQTLRKFISEEPDPVTNEYKNLKNGIDCLIELCTEHLPEVLHNFKAYERVYNTWYNKIQDYDSLAKEIKKREVSDKEQIILKKLGYE